MCDEFPRKVEYLSEAVAQNAAILHAMACPPCPHVNIYPHGDHWHIGHRYKEAGEKCKAAYPHGIGVWRHGDGQ